MKILSEHLDRLRDLYINQLQHLHSGEQQIVYEGRALEEE